MSLPLPVIDRLFSRLGVTYGRDFWSKYEGQDANTVKASWSHELSGFESALPAIAWALENMPDSPPNAIQFRNLCRRAPETEKPRLEAPKADPVIVKMVMDKLTAAPVRAVGRLDWAKKILANPKGRTSTVIQMAKNATGEEA